jgi:membrane protein implicated in regulation of membrane protease activity
VEIAIILAILAAAALAIELSSMTFYLLAVAAALATGSVVAWAGASTGWALAAVALSAAAGLPVAHRVRARLSRPTPESEQLADPDAGHAVRVESVAPEGLRVAYRDTSWAARLADEYQDTAVSPGDLLIIVGRKGNDLRLAPVSARTSAQPADPDLGHLVRAESVAPEGLRVVYRDTMRTGHLADEYHDTAVSPGDLLTIVGRKGNDLVLAPVPARAPARS